MPAAEGPAALGEGGPCSFVWDPDGENIEFKGKYNGKAAFKYEEKLTPVNEAGYGETPVTHIVSGQDASFECDITRISIEDMAKLFPGTTLEGTTTKALVIENRIGEETYGSSKKLIIKPMVGGQSTTDQSKWLTIIKAYPAIAWEIQHNTTEPKVYHALFVTYFDQESASPTFNKLLQIGVAT